VSGDLIAVAMSGGVDSSTAASLLVQQGRAVVGFSMHLVDALDGEEEHYGRCCSPDDFRVARAVADSCGFPHYILNLQDQFRESIIEPFADDYAAGRTPSPCIRCNSLVKFGTLLDQARAVGAARVATGHYAILEWDAESGRTLLKRAADPVKDQSYFLFDLSEQQRRCVEFPLGGMLKSEVRERARELGLAAAERPESMDLCFVREGESYRGFLDRAGLAPANAPGDLVDTDGAVIGRHDGVSNFTVGQRRGIGLSADRRLYVISVDAERNRVVVGDDDSLRRQSCIVERTRWIPFKSLTGTLRAKVMIRSTHEGAPATIRELGGGQAEIRFDEPQRALTPGQAAVAYDGDLVLGGGWITA
jgi:tRNA-specific 2-thiouridylase